MTQATTETPICRANPSDSCARSVLPRFAAGLFAAAVIVLAGCGGGSASANSSGGTFSVTPGTGNIDTNCTGCNATNSQGASVEQFSATSSSAGTVTWSVSGGDAHSGAGTITSAGQYTPPSYLTADQVQVVVTATVNSTTATATLIVTPGFLRPLTPENTALGANGQISVVGYLAEAGGSLGITYSLSNTATGSSGGQGSLGSTNCQRGSQTYTFCTVTFSAPTSIPATGVTYVVGKVGSSSSRAQAEVLLNTAGISSNPATHQTQLSTSIALGTSGGNNNDYDTSGSTIVDCCSGTLGSLIKDSSNRQYLLSNNHVLARSDQAKSGEVIVQPGLIDNNCTPNGDGAGTTPVGTLTGWLALSSATTNADAAIALVDSGAVSTAGNILELGTRQSDGTLAAAPPGISSSGGQGEGASVNMTVAKSGRTTGLTCASISALNLDVKVDYFLDCAETKSYLTKTYTNQLAISGNQFSDAGDSGSLVVDTSNAEPVGLFFAGGTDASGVGQGVASPAPNVLSELATQVGSGTTYTFVGATDHPVTCLNYGDSTVTAAQARVITDEETTRAQQALGQARMLVNPSAGILGVAIGKSSDRPGEAAVVVYVDENMTVSAPATVDGVRTMVIPTNAHAVAYGSAPQTPFEARSVAGLSTISSGVLAPALTIKQQVARSLMRSNPAFFGVGVGQSLDNPKEAALVVYVDRNKIPAQLPPTIDGLRTRYIVMDRLHVTRSYATPLQSRSHCMSHAKASQPSSGSLTDLVRPLSLKLN